MENGKLKRMKDALPGEEVLKKPITRRGFLAGATATSFALLLAACGGGDEETTPAATTAAPPPETGGGDTGQGVTSAPTEEAPLKEGLAEGKWGGPTGFEGAERYQYEYDSEEGRAIQALRKMVQDGTAPDELVVQVLDGAEGHVTVPFPDGAPSLAQLFEEETGIKITTTTTTPETNYTDNLQNMSTKNGSFDLVQTAATDIGDLAEGGLLRNIDDFVDKYQPAWLDPEFGYEGGAPVVKLFNTYAGSYYVVAYDNDTQPYAYRADLFTNPDEMGAFEDQYGRALRFPITWEEHAEVAQFFTRKDADPPLYGDVALKSPFWGIVNWQQRFVSSAVPSMFYFNEDGSANINNEAGIRAAEEHVKAVEWGDPNILTDIWIDMYAKIGSGVGLMGNGFPNITKIMPGNPDLDTGDFGQFVATDLTPGRIVDGQLVRRPVIFFNISWGVNAFADPARHEAAYLFLQWSGGARVYTWLTGNPAGFMDPHHTYSFSDPLVLESYSRGTTNERDEPSADVLKSIIPYTAPPITLRGASEYTNALDLELQKAITGQKSPEQAIVDTAAEWDKITERIGVEKQAAAIQGGLDAWPSAVDEVPA